MTLPRRPAASAPKLGIRTIALTVVLPLAFAACGGDDDDATSTTTPAAAATTSSSSTPAGTEPAATTTVSVYFLRGEKIAATARTVPSDDVATGAIEALLDRPTPEEEQLGFATNIPEGTELLGVEVSDGIATVDLSDAFDDGGGTMSMMARLAEVVFTLTQFPDIEAVTFEIDGEPVSALGGEGILLEEPIDRSFFTDLRPAILVESPRPFEQVSSPLVVSGESSTFENNVVYQIITDDGTVLVDGHTTGTGDTGAWGTFSGELSFDATGASEGTLRVFELSAADGAEENLVEIPIRF